MPHIPRIITQRLDRHLQSHYASLGQVARLRKKLSSLKSELRRASARQKGLAENLSRANIELTTLRRECAEANRLAKEAAIAIQELLANEVSLLQRIDTLEEDKS